MSRRLLIALALVAATAHADSTESPWAKGVTEAQKQRAQVLLEKGNKLLLESKMRDAATAYEQALAEWDHPAIRFNLVKALIGMDKVLEATEHLDKALAYGAAPLEDEVYREALNYQRLLKGQIGTVAIRCGQPGVTIKIDGTEAVRCPGTRELRVLPGTHVVVGAGGGLLTESRDVIVTGGNRVEVALRLDSLEERGRRWPVWQPWALTAAGAGLVGTGIALNLLARSANRELEDDTARLCAASGCSPDEYEMAGLGALEDKVRLRNTLSLVTLGVGGAALIGGGVMVLLNRSPLQRVERVTVIAPHGGIGVAVRGSF